MSQPAAACSFSWTYAGRSGPALTGVELELAPGSWTVIAGPTGSGKSTLLLALAGLAGRISRGRLDGWIRVAGVDITTCPARQLAERVGLLLQLPDDQICTTRVEAEVAFGCANLGLATEEIERRLDAALERWSLAARRGADPRQLSGGQRQRLLLAAIWAMRPRLLVLDEPLSQLDEPAAESLLDELGDLCRQGWTVVMSEHRLDNVLGRADRLCVVDQGRLVADCPLSDDDGRWCVALEQVGLRPPAVTRLAQRLAQKPWRSLPAWIAAIERGAEPPPTEEEIRQAAEELTGVAAPERPPAPSIRELALVHSGERDPSRGEPLLSLDGLTHRFQAAEPPVWQGVSGSIHRGECLAVVGLNGAGKSTLLAALAGLLKTSQGQVKSVGCKVCRRALVLQNPDLMLFRPTVRLELAWAPRLQGEVGPALEAIVDEAARRFALLDLLDEPPLGLSQGQRLRVAVASCWTARPELLLADEPTTGQDPQQVDRVLAALVDGVRGTSPGTALVFSTHDLARVAQYADRVWVLAGGRLLADCSPEALLADDALLAAAGLRRPAWHEALRKLGEVSQARGVDRP